MRFFFIENMVTVPVYQIEAETLEEAARKYARRVADGVDGPDSEEVRESELASVTCGDDPIPQDTWRPVVEAAIEKEEKG